MRRHRVIGTVVALAATVLGVAGCSGDEGVAGVPPTTAPGSPTAAVAPAAAPRRPPARIDLPSGGVRVEDGPFTDRVRVRSLRLSPGPPARPPC